MSDKALPQTYKFQITGYEESNSDTYMLGLGTIDDKNRFTGTLKHENYNRDLSKPAEYDAKSDPYRALYYANYLYYEVSGYFYTVLVSSLPITNITLVQQQEQGVDPDETTDEATKMLLDGKPSTASNKILLASEPATLSNSSRPLDTTNVAPPQLSRAEYEIAPPTDEDYTGPRFKYGFLNKPAFPYHSLESCPNGAIYGSIKKDVTTLHSTIEYPFELSVKEVKGYNLVDFQRIPEQLIEKPFNLSDYEVKPLTNQGASIMEFNNELINTSIFKSTEQQVHNKVFETEKTVIENIDKLEYYKGYAKGMNGLIEKVQANVSLEHVVSEVQKLTNKYNQLNSLNDYSPSFPDKNENPRYVQGQITGITEGVQTLRGLDITKYIENPPAPKSPTIPEYPALSKEEREKHTNFIKVMQKNYPTADIENLNKLCSIASDMTKHTVNNCNGVLSTERFNALTDHQELQIRDLVKDLPGIKVYTDYEPKGAAIKFDLPQGQKNNFGGYAVPEISANKLVPKKSNEFTSPFINTTTKGKSL